MNPKIRQLVILIDEIYNIDPKEFVEDAGHLYILSRSLQDYVKEVMAAKQREKL